MTVFDVLKNWPVEAVLAGMIILLVFVLLIPLVLRLAGLQGQQIIDVLTLTTQFCINLVREFRDQNKSSP